MSTARSALVGLTAASMMTVPVAATAMSPTSGSPTTQASAEPERAAAPGAQRRDTDIRFLNFDRTRGWRSTIHIKGQVTARVDGRRGALRGVRVTLARQFDGRRAWKRLETRRTSRTERPKFRFNVQAKANADYRVVFRGNARFGRSRGATQVSVNRLLNPRLRDGSGRFHGRVQPKYRHEVVFLDKRSCGSCSWRRVDSDRTGDRGGWRFRVRAPRSGRWWWRASTPASVRYVRSISGVFTTELR